MSLDHERRKGLRTDLDFILCCARTLVDDTTAGHMWTLLRGGLNWSEVAATAFEHHVASFLYENLRLSGEGLAPIIWLDAMRQYTRESSRLALLLFSELLRIYEIFEAEQLLLIPFKGPVLSWLAYQSLTARSFVDLDFVLRQEHIPRAIDLLQSMGFSATFEPQEVPVGRIGHPPGQYGFFRRATRAQVELHTEHTLRYFPV